MFYQRIGIRYQSINIGRGPLVEKVVLKVDDYKGLRIARY